MDRARFMTQRVIDDYKEGKIDEAVYRIQPYDHTDVV